MNLRRLLLVLVTALALGAAGLTGGPAQATHDDGAGSLAECSIKIVNHSFSRSWYDVDTKTGNFAAVVDMTCHHRQHVQIVSLRGWYQENADAKPGRKVHAATSCADNEDCTWGIRFTHTPAPGRYCVRAKGKAYPSRGPKHKTFSTIGCFSYS